MRDRIAKWARVHAEGTTRGETLDRKSPCASIWRKVTEQTWDILVGEVRENAEGQTLAPYSVLHTWALPPERGHDWKL